MKYKQNPQLNINKPVGISERQTMPVLSIFLAIAYVLVYYYYQTGGGESWIARNTFQFDQVLTLLQGQKYAQLSNVLFSTNFANLALWQLLVSIYFTCLFAIPVEKRLGPSRFVLLIILACTLPWVLQFMDVFRLPLWPLPFEHLKQSLYFFGPYSVMLALAGAYAVLAPRRPPDRSQSRLQRKDKTSIFNNAEKKAMNEKFGLSPDLFLTVFLFYAIGSHFAITYFYKNYDTIGLYAGLSALIIGYIEASFINLGLVDSYQEHPLKHAAIKNYYELLDLDVGHANAVKGAAKNLGLPDEQVEDWVKKTKGKLRPT